MKFRLLFARPIDEFGDARQLLFALGDQSFQPRGVIKQACFGLLGHKIDHLSQDRFRRLKKLGVLPRDSFVPVSKRLPFSPIRRRAKHVALARQNKIGVDRELQIDEARLKQIDRTARVDRPENAIVLKLLDVFHAGAIKHRLAAVRDEGAVEVGAEKANLLRHRDG